MYLTCNPGGVGHRWVKRLFIDRIYNTSDPDPEARENPADYTFIPATVEDNTHLLNSPGGANYRRMLANMPDNLKRAYRYGDWNALGGSFSPNFPRNPRARPVRTPRALAALPLVRLWIGQARMLLVRGGRGRTELVLPGSHGNGTHRARSGEKNRRRDAAGRGHRGDLRAAGHVEPAKRQVLN